MKLKYLSLLMISLFVAVFLSGCFGGGVEKASIVIKGSTTVLPIAQACAEAFMDKNPNIEIMVSGGGSGVGAASIVDGTSDIGIMSRAMKDKEVKTALDNGVDIKENVVAKDGLAVIVHPSNTVEDLTIEQIKEIYTTNSSDWKKFGSNSGKIMVISRDSASGTFEAFNELALSKVKVRPDSLLQASNRAVASVVASTPGAIGYAGLGYLNETVKAIKVNGIAVNEANVINGTYPLARPLFMYTKQDASDATKKFINFVLSKEGQEIVKQNGFVALTN